MNNQNLDLKSLVLCDKISCLVSLIDLKVWYS